MNMYQAKDDEDFVDSLLHMLEQDTEKEIFTLKILNHTKEGLETLVVFADKSALIGTIKVHTIKGKMAIRMQGNYI